MTGWKAKQRNGVLAVAALLLILAACADTGGDVPTTGVDLPATTVATAGENPGTTQAPPTTAIPVEPTTLPPVDDPTEIPLWDNATLAGVDGPAGTSVATVALVAGDNVLNAREAPGPEERLLGRLAPGTNVIRFDAETQVGASQWSQVITPRGDLWVNTFYLAEAFGPDEFASDSRIAGLVDELANVFATEGDVSTVASARGIYLVYNAPPQRLKASVLSDLLTDDTKRVWPAPDGIDPGPARTFSDAVGASFLDAYQANEVRLNEWNQPGIPTEASPLPVELRSFNHVGVHEANPGDPTDWVSWYLSIAYEDGEPRIVGLTLDTFSP